MRRNFFALLLLFLGAPLAGAQWSWPGYQSRLALDVEDQIAPTAALSTCLGGQIQPDGKDIRIVSVTGVPVKSQVMSCAPLGITHIAFQPIPGLKRYYVYFNNPKETAAQSGDWQPTSGLTLETRSSPGKQYYADALDDVKRYFQNSQEVFGKMFVPTIFFGSSPFRVEGEIVSYCRGFLNITIEGEYTFATTSLDSSFALIDGKEVCKSPGAHDWTGQAAYQGKVTLTKGTHLVEYYHVQRSADMRCALVWQPPKTTQFQMIPEKAFTPVGSVKIVGFDKADAPFAADFDVTRAGDALRGGTQATVYQFKARSWGQEKPATFAWDFGDGTKGTGETIEHVFFGLWEPKVQLTIARGNASDSFARAVEVTPAEGQMDENKVIARVAEIVKTYSVRDVEPKSAGWLIEFLKGANLNQVFAQVIEQQMNAPKGIPKEQMDEYIPLLADAYLEDGQFAKALQRYDEMIQAAGSSNAPEIRRARLRAAECCIHLRKFDEAIQRHKALQESSRAHDPLPPIERSYEMDRVQAAIRQKKYRGARELLEEFILKRPVVLDDDFTFMLRGKAEYGEKKWEAAATDFAFLEKLEPRSNYIPEALFLTGKCYAALNKTTEARQAFDQLIQRFGNSEFTGEAKAELAKWKN